MGLHKISGKPAMGRWYRHVTLGIFFGVVAVGMPYPSHATTNCDVSGYTLHGRVFNADVNTIFSLHCVSGSPKLVFYAKSNDVILYTHGYLQSNTTKKRMTFSSTPKPWLKLGSIAVPPFSGHAKEQTLLFYACKRVSGAWVCGDSEKKGAWHTLKIKHSQTTSPLPTPPSSDVATGTTFVFGGNEKKYAIIREPIAKHEGAVEVVVGGVPIGDTEIILRNSDVVEVLPITRRKDDLGEVRLPSSVLPGVYELFVRKKGERAFLGFVDPFVVYDRDEGTQPTITKITRTKTGVGVVDYVVSGSGFSRSQNVVHIGLTVVRAPSPNGTTLQVSAQNQTVQGRGTDGASSPIDFSSVVVEPTFVVMVNEYGSSEPYYLL